MFANLIEKGGFESYGRFWAFAELFYSMQSHKAEHSNTIRINERTLIKELGMNRRSLPKLLQLFSDTLGICFRNISETIGKQLANNGETMVKQLGNNCETYSIVYETTWDKSLNYINIRNLKMDNKNKNKNKNKNENKKENPKTHPPAPPLKNKFLEFVLLTEEEYQTLIKQYGKEKICETIESLNSYIGSKGVKYKSHYHTILSWIRKDSKEEAKSDNGKAEKIKNVELNIIELKKQLEYKKQNEASFDAIADLEGEIRGHQKYLRALKCGH